MSTTLPAVRSVSIRDSVVDALRNALLAGKFGPGEALSEPALAAQMGISRGPVREALLVLEQEGLVNHNQNRGFSILRLDLEDRSAMTKVRIPLETLALELARPRVGPDDLAQMEAIVVRLVDLYEKDFRLSAREDLSFHEKLWELTGNAWLGAALKRIAVPFFLYTIMYGGKTEQLDTAILDAQHRGYLDYLKGATDKTAEECVRLHLSLYELP